MLCAIHCGIHPPSGCQVHCGAHPPSDCQVHCGVHAPTLDEVKCAACKGSPHYWIAVEAVKKARDQGLVTRDSWEGLRDLAIYTVAEVNALAAVVAQACGDSLTRDVFG